MEEPNQHYSRDRVFRSADLKSADLVRLYYYLRLNRMLEERLSALYRQGTVTATVFTSRGQEATSVGSAYALGSKDFVSPLTRNLGTMLVRGISPRDIFAQYLGKATSPTRGKERIHYFGNLDLGLVASLSVLGDMVPVMAGVALALARRGDGIALVYVGDGTTSTGNFHEGLNMASVLSLPLVVVIENNGYAYSTPVVRQTAIANLGLRARSYGIPSETIDGTDVLEVYDATQRAIVRARRGDGPSIIEAQTMRMGGHSDADDSWYVPAPEIENWKTRDPIRCLERRLDGDGLLTPAVKADISSRIARELEIDLDSALQGPQPKPETALEGVYATPLRNPPDLG
jgi:TPP-dependent pyruvate/acetoin dehydrogenase alpha subunit